MSGKISFGLKKKLLICLVGLVAISSIVMITLLVRRSATFVEQQATFDIDEKLTAFELIVEEKQQGLLVAYEILSHHPGLIEAVGSGDRDAIHAILLPYFEELRNQFGITNLQLNDTRLHAFYRAHNPDTFGDDLSFRPILRNVLAKNDHVLAVDVGRSGMAIRAAGPIYDNNGKCIAILEVGRMLDNELLDNLKENLGVNLTVFHNDERIATTVQTADGERAVGTKITHPKVLTNVLGAGGRWAGRLVIVGSNDIFGAYTAIHDTDGEIIGMFFAGESAVKYDEQKKQDMMAALLLLAVCLGFSAVAALFLAGRITNPIISLSADLGHIAAGDFTVDVKDYGNDEVGMMGKAVKDMAANLRRLFSAVVASAGKVEELSGGVAEASENISASIQDVAGSINEVAASTSQLSVNSQDMTHESNRVSDKASSGEKEMKNTLEQMRAIEDSFNQLKTIIQQLGHRSAEIGEIVKVINEISEQTNLLALNAAIEAARAGEYGRGFAVVADEVRKLAERSSESTKEIDRLITATQKDSNGAVKSMETSASDVEAGITVMSKSAEAFADISKAIQSLLIKIEEVAASSEELSASSQEVAASTEEQSATIEEITAAAVGLRSSAKNLTEELRRFRF